jgi:hypothetical protein
MVRDGEIFAMVFYMEEGMGEGKRRKKERTAQ